MTKHKDRVRKAKNEAGYFEERGVSGMDGRMTDAHGTYVTPDGIVSFSYGTTSSSEEFTIYEFVYNRLVYWRWQPVMVWQDRKRNSQIRLFVASVTNGSGHE